MFADAELEDLRSQPLARRATAAHDRQPTVDAVGFRFDGERFPVGGHNLAASRKYRNGAAGGVLVAPIVADLASTDPRTVRGVKVHGRAGIATPDGHLGHAGYLVVTPAVSWSWGVLGPTFVDGEFRLHRIAWAAGADGAPTDRRG